MTNKLLTSLLPAAALTLGVTFSGSVLATGPALEKGHEYLVVANYPNNMHVIDVETDTIFKSCDLPDSFGPGAIQMAPDGKTAYILNNRYEDIYGVDLDTCEVTFHAPMALTSGERTKSIFSFAISPDGEELYAVQNPTLLFRDHYRVQPPRLAVYDTSSGKNAKPVRTFPAPRQVTVMMTGDDGTLYMAGPDVYAVDVETGEKEVAIASRNWERPLYAPPDVLNVWPIQSPSNDFTILYTTARFQDESYDLNTADWIYGAMNVDLETGETTTRDFGELVEVYFSGMLSPKDDNIVFGVLNRLAKYDIEKQELIGVAELDHSYYCIAMNHAGTKVYLGGTWNDVAIYDAETMEKIGEVQLPGGDMAISTAQVFIR